MQRIVVRKDLYDEIMNKAGLPVGTVHGNYKKVSDNPAKWEFITKNNNPVKYDGEFVLTSKGIKDFGEITTEISKQIKRQAGKIRLRIGVENKVKDKNNPNYGEKHINRDLRLKNLKDVGFDNARDFVEYICSDISYIFNNGKSLIAVREKNKYPYAAYIELAPSKDGDFYDVKTASPLRKDWYKNKTPIWINPKISVLKKNLGNPRASQFDEIIKSIYGISSRSYTSNIPQSGKKSTVKPGYNGEDMLHKSFDITVTEITEKNKQKKIEQVEKALNAIHRRQPFAIRHIKADSDSARYDDIVLRIRDFDRSKIQKAVHKMALTLGAKTKPAIGEAFTYKAQEELTERFVDELTEKTQELYSFLVSFLGLPEVRIIRKSNLTYKGKILYDPESGEPIKKSEWKKFTAAVENFLSRNYGNSGERFVLSAEALGRILARMGRTNSIEAVRKMRLDEMKIGNRKFDWISQSVKNMRDALGAGITDRKQQARIQSAVDSAAQRVSKVTDEIKNNIRQIIIDGIKNKESKTKISQNLFDKCSGLNRDFQRIADTEIQNNVNEAYVKEEVYSADEGEKVYFKRFEIEDYNICKKCRSIKGKIALYSDFPLDSERIKDPYADFAVWEGKIDGAMPIGTVHPYCRGGWYRYYPDIK